MNLQKFYKLLPTKSKFVDQNTVSAVDQNTVSSIDRTKAVTAEVVNIVESSSSIDEIKMRMDISGYKYPDTDLYFLKWLYNVLDHKCSVSKTHRIRAVIQTYIHSNIDDIITPDYIMKLIVQRELNVTVNGMWGIYSNKQFKKYNTLYTLLINAFIRKHRRLFESFGKGLQL